MVKIFTRYSDLLKTRCYWFTCDEAPKKGDGHHVNTFNLNLFIGNVSAQNWLIILHSSFFGVHARLLLSLILNTPRGWECICFIYLFISP